MWDPEMRGVAGDKDTTIVEAISDQPAANPVLLRNNLVFELGAHAQDLPDGPVPVDRIVVRLVVVEKIADEPGLLAINRHHGAAAARVEGEIHPGRRPGQQADQLRCTEVCRLHALILCDPAHPGADGVPHGRAPSVAAHEIAAANRTPFAVIEILRNRGDALPILGQFLELRAIENADSRLRRGIANKTGSRNNWLMRCGGSGVGHQLSSPCSPHARPARDGNLIRESSMPVAVTQHDTSLRYSSGRPVSRIFFASPSRRKISIERADTWLHLTFGGSPARRVSAMVTSMPREARSMASVRPTGPAPTIKTGVSIDRPMVLLDHTR